MQCVVLAGPGFTKDQFFEHLVKRATREDDKRLMAARSKFVLVPASSGHRGALREVMADPAVLARLADTKAARETMAIQKFTKMLDEDPDRAYYGCVRCSIAMSLCGSRRQVASRRSITIFTFSSTLISIPSHCSLCQCNRLFIFSLVLKSSFSCSSSSSSFYNFLAILQFSIHCLVLCLVARTAQVQPRVACQRVASDRHAHGNRFAVSLVRHPNASAVRRPCREGHGKRRNRPHLFISSRVGGAPRIPVWHRRHSQVRARACALSSQSATAGTNTLRSRNRALATLPHLLQRRVGPYRSIGQVHAHTYVPTFRIHKKKDERTHARQK